MGKKATGAHAPEPELERLGRFYTEEAAIEYLDRLPHYQAKRCFIVLEWGCYVVFDPGP